MSKIFTGEVVKMLGIAGLAGIGLMTFLGVYISKARGSFAPYRKKTIIYLLVVVLISCIIGFIGLSSIFPRPLFGLIICQLIFLMLGFIHIGQMHKYLEWSGKKKSIWFEALFTLVVSIFAFMGFNFVFGSLNKQGYHNYLATSAFFLLIAFFIYATFVTAVSIPLRIYEKWFYPVEEEIEDPDETKMTNLLVISFEFQKKKDDEYFTNFRAKAPYYMEFGLLFYYFINDYNERHANEKIEYLNEESKPYGWIFYKKKKWYLFNTQVMDPHSSFAANGIRENDVIVCKRV